MNKDLITELQAEIDRLKSELEKAKVREKEIEESRRATLLMLEDLNISTAQVERAKNEWEATFDSISDPLFIHDKEFKIIRCNKAYAEAAGMTFNHFIGKPYYEVFPKMEKPFKMCQKALELQEEEEYSCPVTNRIFNVRFYPIKDIDKKLLYSVHIMEDITEAKKAAKKIKQEMEITAHLLMIAETTAHITDPDKLMEKVILCGHKITKCDVCLSYLWDTETGTFYPSHALGLPHELIPVFRTEPIDGKAEFVKKAMEGKETVIIQFEPPHPTHPSGGFPDGYPPLPQGEREHDTSPPLTGGERGEGESLFSWLPDVSTLAVLPLIGKTEPLGLIIGIYKKPNKFTDRDKKLMQGISHQVSTALEQTRLYKESVDKAMELSHKIETIQVMHEIDRSILSTLESEEILETVARLASRVVSCDMATVALVDKEKQWFIYAAGFGVTFLQKGAFTPFKDTNAVEVVETGRPQYAANLKEIKNLLPLEEKFLKDGFLSHIRLPLIVKEEVVGLLTIGSKRPSAFTHEDLSTLEKMASQIGVALENAKLVTDLKELFFGTIKTLSEAIDAKSKWTAGHSARVTDMAVEIAMAMGLSEKEIKDIEIAGLLHDIGKIGTYEAILDKPGKLTDEEIDVMKQHPIKGAEILSPIKQLKDIIPAVKHHHEFYDGTGYPDGIKGDEIPLLARILGVADTVDAMAADRPYRKGRAMDEIIAEIKRCSGTQFDPKVAEAFLNAVATGSRNL